eukprot:CAMPEP_0174362826 /NCGR_PEP_ID=MMETSP0811_2-20130205/66354_1 /TAXON_ID=73025 ORGANISM="Eutreptiella gymnastica-like, Strain CCMP1594" /NCGR_SAMPLE_ID=MMETSP0811_2 /ASSEMBLY_ACC=CAM_ASM_000667 /LENGTH=172 /DNA_ID=CAMNT_0015500943 /DNA_START=526 /DNA_END=1045 /DNA_ORIENTATION=-
MGVSAACLLAPAAMMHSARGRRFLATTAAVVSVLPSPCMHAMLMHLYHKEQGLRAIFCPQPLRAQATPILHSRAHMIGQAGAETAQNSQTGHMFSKPYSISVGLGGQSVSYSISGILIFQPQRGLGHGKGRRSTRALSPLNALCRGARQDRHDRWEYPPGFCAFMAPVRLKR